MTPSLVDRCPTCLAPLRSTPQGLCAYCGARLPLLQMGLVPSTSFPDPDVFDPEELAAAAKAGVPPNPADSHLLHLHTPKPHPTSPQTNPSAAIEPNADEVALEPHASRWHLRDLIPSAAPPALSLLPDEALSGYAGMEPTPLTDTPEAEAFIASFDRPLPSQAVPPPPPSYPPSFFQSNQARTCTNCGASIPSGKDVCPNCGTVVLVT